MGKLISISFLLFLLISLSVEAQSPAVSLSELKFNSDFESEVFADMDKNASILSLLFAIDEDANPQSVVNFQNEFKELVNLMKKKQAAYSDEERFLSYLFYKVHRKFLKNYEQQYNFLDLVESGKYDCVSGTAFYALLLDTLGYSYQIKELEYHIYLTVQPQHAFGSKNNNLASQYIFETTDPESGFISNQVAVKKINTIYETENTADPVGRNTNETVHQFDFRINENIKLLQLAGLAYYNSAIIHYNNHELQNAEEQLKKAMYLYNSKRLENFMALINQTIAQYNSPKNSVGK